MVHIPGDKFSKEILFGILCFVLNVTSVHGAGSLIDSGDRETHSTAKKALIKIDSPTPRSIIDSFKILEESHKSRQAATAIIEAGNHSLQEMGRRLNYLKESLEWAEKNHCENTAIGAIEEIHSLGLEKALLEARIDYVLMQREGIEETEDILKENLAATDVSKAFDDLKLSLQGMAFKPGATLLSSGNPLTFMPGDLSKDVISDETFKKAVTNSAEKMVDESLKGELRSIKAYLEKL